MAEQQTRSIIGGAAEGGPAMSHDIGDGPWFSALAGLTTFAWYALPDHVVSKRRRALAKLALLVPVAVYGGLQERDSAGEVLSGDGDGPAEGPRAVRDGSAGTSGVPVVPSPRRKLARGILAGVLVLGTLTAATVAGERLIHKTGERLAKRGVSRPHTKIGAVLGAVVAITGAASSARPGRAL